MDLRVFSMEIRAQRKGAETRRGLGRNTPELESLGVILGHWSFHVSSSEQKLNKRVSSVTKPFVTITLNSHLFPL